MGRQYAKTPTIYQMEATECGAASLAMILGYHGRFEPLELMRVETGVSRDGCNAKNIVAAARKYGLEAAGFRKSMEGLLQLRPPCIIHWNFNHFVVFEGVRGKHAYLNDPGIGRRRLTLEELSEGFTGIVLTFEKTPAFVPGKKKSSLPAFAKARLKGQWPSLGALLLIGLFLVLPGLLIPAFSQVFIDDILLGGNRGWMGGLLLAMVMTLLFQAVLGSYRGLLLERLRSKMAMLGAHRFLYHMFRLPMSFFDQRYAGDLANRVDNNNSVSDFLAGDLAETALNILVAAFYLLLLLAYSPWLTLIALGSVLVNLLLIRFSAGALAGSATKIQQDQGKLVGAVYAGLSITSTLKASGAENEYIARVLGYYAKSETLRQSFSKLQQVLNAITSVVPAIANLLVLMLGGVLVIRGQMTAGMLVAFTALLTSFTQPIYQLVGLLQRIQTLRADMGRVEDIQNYEMDPKFRSASPQVERTGKLEGRVELRGISFGYSLVDPPLVEDFSFTLPSGSTIALVGASGCGKSTVSKIVSGLYTPWGGSVLMDGVPLPQLSREILASSISTVSQSITLFSGTIRENLTLWNQSIKEADIVQAAKDACVHQVITQKPGAYNFALSEGGANLSGGQRQQLEIARALVTNPTVLILDEATSALDPIVEKQILDNIKKRGCTCVIVAHRLSAIRDSEEILVLEQGRIVQRGRHGEMMRTPGAYEKLMRTM